MSAALSASPRISNSTSAAWPSSEIWPALPGSSGERTFWTTSSFEMPRDDVLDRGREGGVGRRERAALDEDALAGGLLEAGVEDPVHPAGLARARRVRVDRLRADHAAEREGDDDEREPAERRRLPVVGAPAAHAGRQVVRLASVACCGHARSSFGVDVTCAIDARTAAARAASSEGRIRARDQPTIPRSYSGRRRRARRVQYVQRVSRIRDVAREYWFELLIALLAVAGMLELDRRTRLAGRADDDAVVRHTGGRGPGAAALRPPALSLRRPGGLLGSLAAALSFVDGLLIPFVGSLCVVGLAAAFLLGNLRDAWQAGIGLAIVARQHRRSSSTTSPDTSPSELVFIPLVFVVAWVAGFALRERAEQAEAAEVRATQAEREREAAARIAVAEERARIARELHDIVAHAVSVMVLQVGAVRHKLPDALAEDRDALRGVERAGRTALAEMRRLLGCDAPRRGRASSSRPSPASTASTRCWRRSAAPGCPSSCTSTASLSRSRAGSTSPPTASCRRA